jgi:hypothetical protein
MITFVFLILLLWGMVALIRDIWKKVKVSRAHQRKVSALSNETPEEIYEKIRLIQEKRRREVKGQRANFLEPPNLPGLLRTHFVATLGNGHRVAYWVGVGQQVVSKFEYEFDTQDHFHSHHVDEELAFAMGITDEINKPVFQLTDGTSSQLWSDWSPRVARSQEPVQERILREFGLSETPGAVINGILQKGLSIWTMTFTESAIYALSETGQQSIRIPWENLPEIRWANFDCGFGELKPTDAGYTTLHEFFHIRFADTWRPFVSILEQKWIQKGIIKMVSFIASEHQEIRFYLISVHDKLFGQHLLFDDRLLYQELKAEGKADEIEKWLEAEMTTFRTGRLQNEA